MKTARPIPPELLTQPGLQKRLTKHIVIRDAGYETACWESTYTKHRSGYTRMTIAGRLWRVHRVAYELWVGPIPAGLVLDHLCRNTICCNPDHLEPVTQRENTARGDSLLVRTANPQTHCVNGHEFTPENTYRWKGVGTRQCRACWGLRYRKRRGTALAFRRGTETHCPHGHERNEQNTYVSPKGAKQCRACNRAAALRYKARKAAA